MIAIIWLLLCRSCCCCCVEYDYTPKNISVSIDHLPYLKEVKPPLALRSSFLVRSGGVRGTGMPGTEQGNYDGGGYEGECWSDLLKLGKITYLIIK
ncbi:hypothetical protein GGR54DRAFT_601444 [Hypoxylon sp. NC1633]|nr:hypothetical protein GGR54DRAFT_601444 [Hypoxylon sp. NC1633]